MTPVPPPDPCRPESDHARLQAVIDRLCRQLPADNLDAAQQLAQREREQP